MSVSYLPELCILPCLHGNIVVQYTSKLDVTMRKTEGLVQYQFVSLKSIIILYDFIFSIFTIILQTCPWQQCFPVTKNTMGYHTGNVCYVVVVNVQLFSYQVRRKIEIQQTRVQKYAFIFNLMSHDVLCTSDVHKTNKKHVKCVTQCLAMTRIPKYTHKNNLCYYKHQ